ncbi:hypothetical protein POV27_03510 [Aureisphaera galaxeae]|uniref:hypothetical protein n=1 Tax=Aureisphaera galaxeae TaxID=1538023 RepID=UPI002350FD37|nr:hypothetical protein [Aureisphaera galaxeae]MDC8003101.1 hypothetical protein [Aureisphaera galaxeae]
MRRIRRYIPNDILTLMGIVIGGIKGYEMRGFAGMLLFALILGAISYQVSKSPGIMAKLLLIIIFLMLNRFLREMLFQLIQEVFGI